MAFCIGALMGVVGIQFAPIQVDVQVRTNEKGSLQYYIDTGVGFNERLSKRIQLSGSPNFSHYVMATRANGICAIRINPLETQGQFEVRDLRIDYLFWHRQWQGYAELNRLFSMHKVDVQSAGEAVLAGRATGNDSGLVITDLEYLNHWKLVATIPCAMLGGIIAFLLLIAVRRFGWLKAVLASGHTPLFIIVTTATLLRIIYWRRSGWPSEPGQLKTVWGDEATYFSIAQYIMTHGWKDYLSAEQSVMVPPMNPVYLALIYPIVNSVDAIRTINLLISVLSIVLVYKLGKKIFSKPVGLLAAGMCAVHGQFILLSATLMTEPLFLCLFIASIYFLVLTLETQNLPRYRYQGYALASAILLTITILTRSIVILLPVFLLTAFVSLEAYRSWRTGKPSFPLLKRVALPLFLPILVVGMVATKNYIFFGRAMVATGAGASLWLGSRADTEGDDPPSRGLSEDTSEITHGASHISIQGDMLLMEEGKKNIREDPLRYASWSVKKIGRLVMANNFVWFYPHKNIADWYRASGGNAITAAYVVFQVILASSIFVYGLIGLVAAIRQDSFYLIISASACYLIIFSIPFVALQRYGLPLVMLLVIPASAIMYGAWHATGRLRRIALFGMPLVLGFVLQILFLE